MRRVLAAGRAAVIVGAVGAAMVVASALPAMHAQDAPAAVAAAGPQIEIAALGSSTWGEVADGGWRLTNAQAGAAASGGVQLRTSGLEDAVEAALTVGLRPAAVPNAAGAAMLEAMQVTSMSLGGLDVLPRWSGCTGGGTLTLAVLVQCPAPPELPAPAAAGSTFLMDLRFAPGAVGGVVPNELQGASTGPLVFTFTLAGDLADVAGGGAPPGEAPDAPAPGSTGYGFAPLTEVTPVTLGVPAVLLTLALYAAWALLRRRRRA